MSEEQPPVMSTIIEEERKDMGILNGRTLGRTGLSSRRSALGQWDLGGPPAANEISDDEAGKCSSGAGCRYQFIDTAVC